ncbi:hypothetical protein A5721_33465 [Mycobacterium vulneris]|nr:hypothetical protein A5721_33465 [Mycolicibacterium vulneris]
MAPRLDPAARTTSLPTCPLPFHHARRRVQFHRWDNELAAMVTVTGVVVDHWDRQLRIRTDDGAEVVTSCGHVIAERVSVA